MGYRPSPYNRALGPQPLVRGPGRETALKLKVFFSTGMFRVSFVTYYSLHNLVMNVRQKEQREESE